MTADETGRALSEPKIGRSYIPAFENLTNPRALPANGFVVIAMPMKIAGGSGGPLWIAAIVP